MKYFVAVVLFAAVASAQVQQGGSPTAQAKLGSVIDTKVMGGFDVNAWMRAANAETKDQVGGNMFAQPFPVSFSPLNSGTWDALEDGTKVWRLSLVSEGAASLNLYLSQYVLFPGNELFVYDEEMTQVRGAFTEKNNKDNGKMAIAPISGDRIVVELVVRAGAEMPQLEIGAVNHEVKRGYGDSGSCNINAVCQYADAFRDEVDSSAMILTSAGSRRCSGALINNAASDGRQLFLTAHHCLGGSDTWIFMFNYQSPQCNQSQQSNGPTSDTVQGSRIIANGAISDYALLELTEAIPASYGVYYSGYNAVNEPFIPFSIHHPSGDIKKIAWSNDPTVHSTWSGTPGTHWRVERWHGPGSGNQDQGDRTTTEPGSSGSPLHDEAGRITSQLHGGAATCSNPVRDEYGKLAYSWDNDAAVRAALDPNGGSARLVDGYRP